MGCCGSSSTSPGPSHASWATSSSTSGTVALKWRVTKRDGSVSWFADQILAYAEAGVSGGAVDYVPEGQPTDTGVSP